MIVAYWLIVFYAAAGGRMTVEPIHYATAEECHVAGQELVRNAPESHKYLCVRVKIETAGERK